MNTEAPDSQALAQGVRLEEFEIERVLGSGGFGITYLARDTGLGRRVVIKENLPAQFAWRETTSGTVRPRHSTTADVQDYEWSMQNFLREAATLASLDHPGIVRILRQFAANGTAYFVMPFVEGVAFDRLIEERKVKNKPFTQEELLGITTRMLNALKYLHERDIYHRDIKPANILITQEGVPALIDFGSARQSIGERSMTVIESAGYTPFEQLQSRGNVGPWSDLYAFGATLAKTITFETPPKAADRMMGDPWPGLVGDVRCSSLSDWFLQAIDRSMAVDPSHRWQNAKEWTEFLEQGVPLASGGKPPASPPISIQSAGGAGVRAGLGITTQNNSPSIGKSEPRSAVNLPKADKTVFPRKRSWEDDYVATQCPHCSEGFRFQMKALRKSIFTCPCCGKGINPSSLRELHPEDASPYLVLLPELFFSYKGRIGRKEYWLVGSLPALFFLIFGSMLIDVSFLGGLLIFAWLIWSVLVCLPITAKRLHDHDMSGHLMWLLLIPYINGIVSIWFLVRLGAMPGKNVANKYGPSVSQIKTPLR